MEREAIGTLQTNFDSILSILNDQDSVLRSIIGREWWIAAIFIALEPSIV